MREKILREGKKDRQRDGLAASLQDGLGQSIIGMAMLARSHANAMEDSKDPEANRARLLQTLLAGAVTDVDELIRWLDHGRPR